MPLIVGQIQHCCDRIVPLSGAKKATAETAIQAALVAPHLLKQSSSVCCV